MNAYAKTIFTALVMTMVLFSQTQAQSVTGNTTVWTGAASTSTSAGGNWDNGTPGRADNMVFDDPTTVPNSPVIPAGLRTQSTGITFNQAGWTVGVADAASRVDLWADGGPAFIDSNGVGVNRIGRLTARGSRDLYIEAGNILIIEDTSGSGVNLSSMTGTGTVRAYGDGYGDLPGAIPGTVLMNGIMSNSGFSKSVDVSSGAVLGGQGTIIQNNAANYTIQSGATLAPGELGLGDTSAGTLALRNDRVGTPRQFTMLLDPGSTLALDLFNDGSGDQLFLSGDADLSPMLLSIDSGVTLALSGSPVFNQSYTLAQFENAGTFTGAFDFVTLNGNPLTAGTEYTLAYNPHAAQDPGTGSIELTLIPEPSTLALLMIAFGSLLMVSRRRR